MILHSYVINADIAPFYFARHYLYMFQPYLTITLHYNDIAINNEDLIIQCYQTLTFSILRELYHYLVQPLVCHELILQQHWKNNKQNKDDGHNEVKTMMKFNCKSYGKWNSFIVNHNVDRFFSCNSYPFLTTVSYSFIKIEIMFGTSTPFLSF
jgi:hypothetical protein